MTVFLRVLPAKDLTVPIESTATLRGVLGELLQKRARSLGQLPLARAKDASAIRRSLAHAKNIDRGALMSALRRPTVSAPLSCIQSSDAVDPLLDDLADALAAELGLAPLRPALSLKERARIDVSGEPIDRPYHPIDREIVLALADNNPLAMLEAHPDKAGNAIDLGEKSADEWCAELRADLEMIDAVLPHLRAEMDLLLHQIVPVGYDAQKHLSASYREAIGTIYLTLHPQRLTMVEAVIHEFQHNKLNAVLELDPVLLDKYEAKFTSPVRPDPRPLLGILLAVHAFVPVAELYRRLIEREGDPQGRLTARRDQIVTGNREGLAVLLEHAHPSDVGRALFDELRAYCDA